MPAAALRMTARSVTMTLNWNVPPGEARPITEALHVLMIAARAERGYVNCSLSAELGDFAKVRYREEWRTEEICNVRSRARGSPSWLSSSNERADTRTCSSTWRTRCAVWITQRS